MSGRIYKITSKRRINHFSYERYNSLAENLLSVTRPSGKNFAKLKFDKEVSAAGYAPIVKSILNQKGYSNTIESSKNTLTVTFSDDGKARSAAQNVLTYFPGDYIDEEKINSDGTVKTQNDLWIKVDPIPLVDNPDNEGPDNEGPDTNKEDASKTNSSGTTWKTNKSSWTTWALIGGGLLALVIVVALFLKKKK